jgi:hypothetical protein
MRDRRRDAKDSGEQRPWVVNGDTVWPAPLRSARGHAVDGNVVPIGSPDANEHSASRSSAPESGATFFAGGPAMLTVVEAAAILRIGRSLAYDLARRYEVTGGAEGLPVVRFGSCLRVPRWALNELIMTGRVVQLPGNTGRQP